MKDTPESERLNRHVAKCRLQAPSSLIWQRAMLEVGTYSRLR